MSQKLTLQLPDNLYQPLAKAAAQAQQSPEELAAQWLSQAIQQFTDDPVEQFIGAISSTTPDWVEQHDRYLGQAQLDHSEEI